MNYYWYSNINNVSHYYTCWNQFLLLNIFVVTVMHSLMKIMFNEIHLFEIEHFCNVINLFTVTQYRLTDQYNVLLNIYKIFFFFTFYWPQTSPPPKKTAKTVFNIDINQRCFLSSKSAYYYDFWRSCDTEDWSNDVENSALITGIKYILILQKKIFI